MGALKNKLDDYLLEVSKIDNWAVRESLISAIAYKIKIKAKELNKRIKELENLKKVRKPIRASELLKKEVPKTKYWIEKLIPKDTTKDNIIGLKSDFSLNLHRMIDMDIGVDLSQNKYENERLSSSQNRKQIGFFTQLELNPVKNLSLMAGGRYDKITDIKGYFNPRFSAIYSLTPDLKFRGSFGGGFRAPSFIELYSNFQILRALLLSFFIQINLFYTLNNFFA